VICVASSSGSGTDVTSFRGLSPPRLSRWRVVLPEEAGIGLTPAKAANGASERTRPAWDQAVWTTATVTGPMPVLSSSYRRLSSSLMDH
jgi:hypothetical protein